MLAREQIERFYAEEDGWHRERLYRPDLIITEWRKLASVHNRGIQRPRTAPDANRAPIAIIRAPPCQGSGECPPSLGPPRGRRGALLPGGVGAVPHR